MNYFRRATSDTADDLAESEIYPFEPRAPARARARRRSGRS
jgi:hypothetical protein